MKSPPPPLELNWQFQAPKVWCFFRRKILSFIIFFWIFINFNLATFKKKKFKAWENNFSAQKMYLLCNISQWTPCSMFLHRWKKNSFGCHRGQMQTPSTVKNVLPYPQNLLFYKPIKQYIYLWPFYDIECWKII